MPDDVRQDRAAQQRPVAIEAEDRRSETAMPSILEQAIAATRIAPPEFLVPKSYSDVEILAKKLCDANWVPKSYQDKSGRPVQAMVEVAIMHGMEIGLRPMAALQSIAVINGMPSLWGDGMLAVVRASGTLEWMQEVYDGAGEEMACICTVKRRGEREAIVERFSVAMAKRAGLWGKQGPWSGYPARMLKMRARAWALRGGFADILKGMQSAEEMTDMMAQVIEATERELAANPPPPRPARHRKQDIAPEPVEAAPAAEPASSQVEEPDANRSGPVADETGKTDEKYSDPIPAPAPPEPDRLSEDEAFARSQDLMDRIAACRSTRELEALEQAPAYKEIQYWPAQQRDAVAGYFEEHRTKLQKAAVPRPKAGQAALAGLEP